MATQLKTKLKTRHVPMVSVSATLVKTLAGAQAYKAKRKISVEDDKHITDIARGETFYLKHDVKRKAYVLFDVDQDDNTIYKFIIDRTTYNKLVGAHTELGSVEKKPTAKKPAKPSRPKARKPQDYKDQVPFDRSDRTDMVQTIFQGSIKTTPTSMTVTIDMDVAQVKREAKKAGFRVLTTKGSVVKFVHADGTQMDVAVKEDYLAVRFN